MNDKRQDRRLQDRHLNDERLPGEVQLSRLYREIGEELPPPELDTAVRTAARQPVRAQSKRVYAFSLRKWAVPFSLAAAFLIVIELTLSPRNQVRQEALQLQSSPAAPALDTNARRQPEESPVAEQRQMAVARSGAAPEEAASEKSRQRFSPPASAPQPTMKVQQAPQQEKDQYNTLPMGAALPDAPVDSAPASSTTQTAPQVNAPSSAPMFHAEAEVPVWHSNESGSETSSAPSSHADAAASLARKTKPQNVASGAIESQERETKKEEAQESLTPEAWVAKLNKLRRAGKCAEAEASLKTFKRRYPDYRLEKLLSSPCESR